MATLAYEIVDVFTDRPFAGNPLAVVFGAGGLAREQLQAVAREFNLSETVFVLPPTTPEATYRARIFTPAAELPFAGHPSVGCAVTQVRLGMIEDGSAIQECGAGLLPIEIDGVHHRATLAGGTPTVGPALEHGALLDALGLAEADHLGPAPRTAGMGLEFTYVSVTDAAVARIAPLGALPDVCVFHWDATRHRAHVRVLVPGLGVAEDPATGSAALGLGAWLVTAGLLPGDGASSYTIDQGAEIHRPSTLECTVTAVGGTAVSGTVSGHVVPIAAGSIVVPPFVG